MLAVENYNAGVSAANGADDRIIGTVRSSVAEAFPRGLRALVLTGSIARREGTWVYDDDNYNLRGDAEFIVVFADRVRLPSARFIERLAHTIELRLQAASVHAHIGLSPVDPGYLRKLQPHIFAYELVQHGRVVWGERHIFELAPRFSPADIPLDDGLRLLMNRMIELLEVLCTSRSTPAEDKCCAAVNYRAMKLWLDMATSFLLFHRRYKSTYRSRAESLAQMASECAAGDNTSVDSPIQWTILRNELRLRLTINLGPARGRPPFPAEICATSFTTRIRCGAGNWFSSWGRNAILMTTNCSTGGSIPRISPGAYGAGQQQSNAWALGAVPGWCRDGLDWRSKGLRGAWFMRRPRVFYLRCPSCGSVRPGQAIVMKTCARCRC